MNFGNRKNNGNSATPSSDTIVSLRGVHKVFKTKSGEYEALRGIDLDVKSGEFVGIVGPSGSGKSTLINMVTGIDRPTSGDAYIGGQLLNNLNENQIAQWRGKNVGVVFQFFQLLPTMTVLENTMLPMQYTGTYKGKRRDRALEVLETVMVSDIADKYPSQISGGQQQRAAIARALVNDPQIIVGDEPTGNLDIESASMVFALFQELCSRGKTILMVTHDKDLAGLIPRVEEVRAGELISGTHIDSRLVS